MKIILNDTPRRLRRVKRGFYQLAVHDQPIHIDADKDTLSHPILDAIREIVQHGIQSIQARTTDGRRWANDTGRMASGISVTAQRDSYAIHVSRDRLGGDRWTPAALARFRQRLNDLVPALSHASALFGDRKFKAAVTASLKQMIKVERRHL